VKEKAWFVRVGPFFVLVPRSWQGVLLLVACVIACALALDRAFIFADVNDQVQIIASLLLFFVSFLTYFVVGYLKSRRA